MLKCAQILKVRVPLFLLSILRLLRPAQWVKNTLVVIAAISSHRIAEPGVDWALLRLFVAMSLLASAIYVLNDALDRQHDQLHPQKKRRPFASGELSPAHAFWLVPLLLLGVAMAAWSMPIAVIAVLAGYVATNLLYSLWLKRLLWMDVLVLAGLYSVRVLAGAFAIDVAPSEWLLAFSMFAFVSLAALKRVIELQHVEVSAPGRGYRREDIDMLKSFGVASSVAAVLVMALYVNSDAVRALYDQPAWLWGICALFWYWLARIWTLAARGQVHHDPVLFAVRDATSWVVALLVTACVALAT